VTERLIHRPVLGLRFTDAATGAAVIDDLDVGGRTADRALALSRPLTSRGAFGAHAGTGPATLTVRDRAGRFLPLRFGVDLPAGLLLDPCGDGGTAIELASAPTRAVPAGYAAIHARLWDRPGARPASWARLRAECGGHTATGTADARGRVLVLLPWPAPVAEDTRVPPLHEARWPVVLTAFWSPGLAVAEDVGDREIVPPDLCALRAQPQVSLLDHDAPLPAQQLAYGRALIVRSTGSSDLHLDPTP
jgi:hypothetical protein